MTNDPKDVHTVSDPSLFFQEAAARLRVAASLISHAGDAPDEWDGNTGWAKEVALDVIGDVADSLEAFEAACDAKAQAEREVSR